jgi:polygalacturonase
MLLNAAVLLLLTITSMAYALPAFNVVRYGAAGNGNTLDSPAIQRAIDAASVHGGTVIVPAGTYLSGSIFVKSGVTLEIQSGATILGSQLMLRRSGNILRIRRTDIVHRV